MSEAPRLSHPHGLVEPANGVDVRPALLRAMVNLYVQKPTHTEQEEQHFTRRALRLMDRGAPTPPPLAAHQPAGYPPAPAAVRRGLLKDLIPARAPAPPYTNPSAPPGKAPAPADELSELF